MQKFTKRSTFFLSLALLMASLLLTTSCKKDNPDPIDPFKIEPACKLLKAISNDGYVEELSYDDKARLIKYSYQDGYWKYEYDNNNRVVKVLSYRGDTLQGTRVLEYNATGQWNKSTYTLAESNHVSVTTAEYDNNGNRIKIVSKDIDGNVRFTRTFEYAGGNLTKETYVEENQGSTDTRITAFEYYTDKGNKLREFYEVALIGYLGTPSKNMVKKEKYSSQASSSTYAYEFNEQGFPIKWIRTKEGSPTQYTTTFEYLCK